MLDLYDPKPDPPDEEGRPSLRLVPKGPRVSFSRPGDPETRWTVRVASIFLGLVISGIGLAFILLTAALLKQMYENVDALDAAVKAERTRRSTTEAPARNRGDGAIVLTMPKDQPRSRAAPQSPPASKP